MLRSRTPPCCGTICGCIPGEQVELWNLWVSDIRVRAFRLTGPLADLDADALVQMAEREQTCITLTI